MPRIREIITESSTRAAIPTNGANPADFGAGAGAAMAQFGETLARVGEHYDRVRRETMLGAATARATQELQEYSFGLQNGTLDDEGNVVPPPDPSTHFESYNRKAQEIRARVKSELGDDRLYGLFEQDFGKVALRQSFEVRKHVIERQKAAAAADFEGMADALADTAARGDDFTRKQSIELFRTQLGKFVAAGVIDPVKAQEREQKFLSMVDRAQIREAIRTNPEQAIGALLSKDAFPNLPPDQRETYLRLAAGESERALRARTQEEERARRERERLEKDNAERVFKDAMDLAASGKLTMGWVQKNRDHIAKGDYDNLVKIAVKGGSLRGGAGDGEGNTQVYIDLRDRASRGEDIRGEAKRAFADGRIKLNMFNTLMNEAETRAADGGGWYKDGTQYIKTALAPSPTNPKLTGMTQANALDDWQEWARNNPKATREDANLKAREIAERYHMVAVGEQTIGKPRPYRHTGSEVTPQSVRQSRDALVKDYMENRISPEEYNREVRNLRTWNNAAERAAEAPKAGASAPKSGKSGK